MKPIVSRPRAVAAVVVGSAVITACGSSQKQLTEPQQAAAQAEDQAQKAQADAQKAREEANKTQKDLAEAQQAHNEAQAAEMEADHRARDASHQASIAEHQAGIAARAPEVPPAAPVAQQAEGQKKGDQGVAEAQGAHDSAGKVTVITASLLFKSGSAELLPSAKPKLDEVAQALSAAPQANDVKVEGYTDSTGTAEINDPLSQQRAQAVADYLQSKGVPQDRITAQGFGEQDPVSHAQTAEGRALNRRVDIVIEPVQGQGKAPAGQQQQPSQQQPSQQQR
jgi:outer membrane protein OmpA-like peptidoglycan-associated protein